MKLLITGAAGQLGTELLRQLQAGGSVLGKLPKQLQKAQVNGVDLADGNLAELAEVRALLQKYTPDTIINCAAYTNVDGCETDFDNAFKANALAPRNLAIAAQEMGSKVLHVSTDYVFAGQGNQPVNETVLPSPKSAYGATKLAGEQYLQQFCSRWFVVRTAWLYGRNGGNFVKTMLRLAKNNGGAAVVNDQWGNPTNAEDLAHHLLQLVPTEQYGIYHCTGQEVCSWYDFASEIIRLSGLPAVITPCTTAEFQAKYPQSAKRPSYSALDNAMLRVTVGDTMRTWQQALQSYMQQYTVEQLLA